MAFIILQTMLMNSLGESLFLVYVQFILYLLYVLCTLKDYSLFFVLDTLRQACTYLK